MAGALTEPFRYPAAVTALIRDHLSRDSVPERVRTPREEEIVKLIAEGNSTKEIADCWSSAPRPWIATARTSSPNSGMRDHSALTRYAIREGRRALSRAGGAGGQDGACSRFRV